MRTAETYHAVTGRGHPLRDATAARVLADVADDVGQLQREPELVGVLGRPRVALAEDARRDLAGLDSETADLDLIVGAADPYQLFRIMVEVIRGGGYGAGSDVALMLDQCHNVEDKIPGQIRSVLNVQEMTARALLVDGDAVTTDADKLAKVTVTAEVLGELRGPKIVIQKFKNKTGYKKRQGHRQDLTRVKVTGIK